VAVGMQGDPRFTPAVPPALTFSAALHPFSPGFVLCFESRLESCMNETSLSTVPPAPTLWKWIVGVVVAAIAWVAVYSQLTAFADWVVASLGLERGTHFAEAVHFFFYDTPKVLLLLTGIVFLMGIIQTFFSPERTRALLSGKRLGVGNVLAAALGIVTPFCSCSAVPLFIGFLSAACRWA
jgi:hypothetical protein